MFFPLVFYVTIILNLNIVMSPEKFELEFSTQLMNHFIIKVYSFIEPWMGKFGPRLNLSSSMFARIFYHVIQFFKQLQLLFTNLIVRETFALVLYCETVMELFVLCGRQLSATNLRMSKRISE